MSSSNLAPSGMCTPLIIYLAIVAVQMVAIGMSAKVAEKDKMKVMGITILVAAFWGVIMYQLCLNGHQGWSWFILLLPLIVAAIMWVF